MIYINFHLITLQILSVKVKAFTDTQKIAFNFSDVFLKAILIIKQTVLGYTGLPVQQGQFSMIDYLFAIGHKMPGPVAETKLKPTSDPRLRV